MTHGSYFTFEAYAFPASTLGVRPRLPRGPWLSGTRIEYPIDEPLSFELDADYPGEVLPYYASAAPLMRGDLVDAIRAVEGPAPHAAQTSQAEAATNRCSGGGEAQKPCARSCSRRTATT